MDQNVPDLSGIPQENSEVDIPLRHLGWMAGLVIIPLILVTFVIPLLKPKKSTVYTTEPAAPLIQASSLFATVISVKGSASLSRNNAPLPAVINLAVLPKDTLETGAESNLGLLFDDGSILRLEENSKVQISEYTHEGDAWIIILDQLWGRTWNRVQKLTASSVYEVRTATAIASVRGTTFGVDTTNTSSAINVTEGTVVAKIMDKPTTAAPAKVIKEVTIAPKQQVDIKKTDVEIIRRQVETKLPTTLAIVATNTEITKIPEWVVKNNEEDKRIAPIIEKIRQQAASQPSNADTNRETIREIVKEIVPTILPSASPAATVGASPVLPSTLPSISPTINNLPNPPAGCNWLEGILVCATPTIAPTPTRATSATNSILANPTYAAYYQSKITPSPTQKVEPTPMPTLTTSSTTGTN